MKHPKLVLTLSSLTVGAALGAACGVVTLVPIPMLHALHPTPDDAFVSAGGALPWAALIGAVLGALSGPILAWALLRRVPLWRVFLELPLGTVVGSIVGWIIAFVGWLPGIPAIVSLAVIGATMAALRLRHRFRKETVKHLEPAI